MSGTGRAVLGAIGGVVLWSVLWVGGAAAAQAALPDLPEAGQRVEAAGPLLGFIVYSVLLSVLAGWTAAAVAGAAGAMRAAWIAAALLLALGLYFEVTGWALAPVWYHVVFLVLLVPATVYGGKLKTG